MSDWKMDGKPALVVLHMQQAIFGSGAWEKGSRDTLLKAANDSGMIPNIHSLLKAFREKHLPVVFVSACPNPLSFVPAYGKLFSKIIEINMDPSLLTSASTRQSLEVIPEFDRRNEEPLLFNWLLGGFTNSGLDLVLKSKGVKTVVLVGFATHSIVYNTALQAGDLWYSTIIPRDASMSRPQMLKAYEAIMNILAPTVALVTSTEDVINHLK